jgi:hypothetical protein
MIMSQDKRFFVWSDNDPNDSFEVDAPNVDAAAWAALQELGWCVGAEPMDDEDATGNNK